MASGTGQELQLTPPRLEKKEGVKRPLSYMDIREAIHLLERMQLKELKINQGVFTQPLYLKTALGAHNRDAAKENPERIFKKNVYFMARNVNNVDDVLTQLVQFGVLSLDDRDYIDSLQKSLIKAVIMFSTILGKDESKYLTFREVMDYTNNEDIAQLLDECLLDEAAYDDGIRLGSAPREIQIERTNCETLPNAKSWTCSVCTFENECGNVCQVCNHSMTFPEMDQGVAYECSVCTLLNNPGVKTCQACDNPLGE